MSNTVKYLNELVLEGEKYNFDNNSYFFADNHTYYSRATPDFLAWVSKVENFIRANYDKDSGPYKMLESVNKEKFSGNFQSSFDKEINKLKGAIKSCINLKPNKKANNNLIISLLKNPFFWTALVVVIGASYPLGVDIGKSKFDMEKIEMNKQNMLYKDSILKLNKELSIYRDTIKRLKFDKKNKY